MSNTVNIEPIGSDGALLSEVPFYAADYAATEMRIVATDLRSYQTEASMPPLSRRWALMGCDFGLGPDRTVEQQMHVLPQAHPGLEPGFYHYSTDPYASKTTHTSKIADYPLPEDIFLSSGHMWEAPLQVRLQPAAVLRMLAQPITEAEYGPKVEEFGQRMIDVMKKFGGVGLAANQVGLLKRMFVMQLNYTADKKDGDLIIVCNPTLELEGEEVLGSEGCLSMPGVYGKVWRSTDAFLRYFTPLGEPKALMLSKLEARIAQHEFDHLDGIEFDDKLRMVRHERKAIASQWKKLRPGAVADKKGI